MYTYLRQVFVFLTHAITVIAHSVLEVCNASKKSTDFLKYVGGETMVRVFTQGWCRASYHKVSWAAETKHAQSRARVT